MLEAARRTVGMFMAIGDRRALVQHLQVLVATKSMAFAFARHEPMIRPYLHDPQVKALLDARRDAAYRQMIGDPNWQHPPGHTWRHHENCLTMILVPQAINNARQFAALEALPDSPYSRALASLARFAQLMGVRPHLLAKGAGPQ